MSFGIITCTRLYLHDPFLHHEAWRGVKQIFRPIPEPENQTTQPSPHCFYILSQWNIHAQYQEQSGMTFRMLLLYFLTCFYIEIMMTRWLFSVPSETSSEICFSMVSCSHAIFILPVFIFSSDCDNFRVLRFSSV